MSRRAALALALPASPGHQPPARRLASARSPSPEPSDPSPPAPLVIPGQQLGRLVAVVDLGRDAQGCRLWAWRCGCGRELPIRLANVLGLVEAGEVPECRRCSGARLAQLGAWIGR